MSNNNNHIKKDFERYPQRYSLHKGFEDLPDESKACFKNITNLKTHLSQSFDVDDLVRFYRETFDVSVLVNTLDTPDDHHHEWTRTHLWHYAFLTRFKLIPLIFEIDAESRKICFFDEEEEKLDSSDMVM